MDLKHRAWEWPLSSGVEINCNKGGAVQWNAHNAYCVASMNASAATVRNLIGRAQVLSGRVSFYFSARFSSAGVEFSQANTFIEFWESVLGRSGGHNAQEKNGPIHKGLYSDGERAPGLF